jgi:hypothetical protein
VEVSYKVRYVFPDTVGRLAGWGVITLPFYNVLYSGLSSSTPTVCYRVDNLFNLPFFHPINLNRWRWYLNLVWQGIVTNGV